MNATSATIALDGSDVLTTATGTADLSVIPGHPLEVERDDPTGDVEVGITEPLMYAHYSGQLFARINYVKAGAPTGDGATIGEVALDTTTGELWEFAEGDPDNSWVELGTLTEGQQVLFLTNGTDTSGNSGTHTATNNIYRMVSSAVTTVVPAEFDAVPSGATPLYYDGTDWEQLEADELSPNSLLSGTMATTFTLGNGSSQNLMTLAFGSNAGHSQYYIRRNDNLFDVSIGISADGDILATESIVAGGPTFTEPSVQTISTITGGIAGEHVGADDDIHAGDGVYGRAHVHSYGNLEVNPTDGVREGSVGVYIASDDDTATPKLRIWQTTAGTFFDHVAGSGEGRTTALPMTFSKDLGLASGTKFRGFKRGVVTKTANYAITTADYFIICDPTGPGMELTLLDATTCAGQEFMFANRDDAETDSVSLTTVGGQSIVDFSATAFTGTLNVYDQAGIISDGANWQVTMYRTP